MKSKNLINFIKLGVFSVAVAFTGSSCVKSYPGYTDLTTTQPTVLISDGGLQNFKTSALLLNPLDDIDTTNHFFVNYAATNVAPQDETVTIAIDPDAITSYNATGGIQYTQFPDSIYSFTATSVTIPKGENYSPAQILTMFPSKVDATKNYMLPITIKTAPSGSTIATNFQTIYYHLIGNPIAGLYTQEWIRWNNSTGTGTPNYDLDLSPGVFAPVDNTTVSIASGTGVNYLLSFTNTGGVLSNFQVTMDAASVTAAGITITAGPFIVTADPSTGTYQFQFNYSNSSGSPRYIIDKFGK